MNESLVKAVRAGLKAAGDPVKAPQMRAYMKSVMPYRGVSAPALRALCQRLFRENPMERVSDWKTTVLTLWRGAKYREERYAAIELTGWRTYRVWQTPALLPIYEELIVVGAWWDYVDAVAIHRIGPLLRDYPGKLRPVMRRWSRCDNLWKRRSAIIAQVGFRETADFSFMREMIEPALGEKEFFLRKAIGWALRQHARADPGAVRAYVRSNETRLSPLSRREAMKHL